MTAILVPTHAMPQATVPELLNAAKQSIAEGAVEAANLAALRAAAAMVAVRCEPRHSRARIVSVWALLVMAAPEFHEWAAYWATKPTGNRVRANALRFVELVEVALVPAEARLMGEGEN